MAAVLATSIAAGCGGGGGGGASATATPSPTADGVSSPVPTPIASFAGTWEDFKLEFQFSNLTTTLSNLGTFTIDEGGNFGVDENAATGYAFVTGRIDSSGNLTATMTAPPLAPCTFTAKCVTFTFCSAIYAVGAFTSGNSCNNGNAQLIALSTDR